MLKNSEFNALKNLMISMNWSPEQAMDVLRTPQEERAAKSETLESKVAERTGYYNYIDSNMNESYKPTIQKLVGKGLLQGNENGELMLTNDMMRILTVIDRTGLYD